MRQEISGEAGMSSVPTVFARSVRKIARAVAPSRKARRLLNEVGLELEAIQDPALRIPYADMMMLSSRAAEMTKDYAFGLHVGERVEQAEYGLVGLTVITSATLGEALRNLARYSPIWADVGRFRLDEDGDAAFFQWEFARCALPDARQDCEMTMAAVARLDVLSSTSDWRPREVWFEHAKPRDTSEHARIFRAPVRFGMPMNAVLLDRALLSLPMANADAYAHRAVTAAAEGLLAQGEQGELSRRVASFARQQLESGGFGLEAAARHLGVGKRTLQRRLKQESSSYRQTVEGARRELARDLLLSTDATTSEIADALGFSDPSVFYRAIQEWYGTTPTKYRRKVRALG
jgi:AraC-like DNA-binding protein